MEQPSTPSLLGKDPYLDRRGSLVAGAGSNSVYTQWLPTTGVCLSVSQSLMMYAWCAGAVARRVPSYMSKELGIHSSSTLWGLLIGLVLFALACPLAGHFIGDTKV